MAFLSRARSRAITFCGVSLILGLVGVIFWYQDWRYSLPTPRPPQLAQPEISSALALPAGLTPRADAEHRRPVLLHFFNPGCPCSRFNLDHLRALRKTFGDRVEFVAVLQGDSARELAECFDDLRLDMDWRTDVDGRIARACGVYSTPQAVILDSDGRLFYRGNYNASRYCTGPETEFARLVLEALLAGRETPLLTAAATTAYGCELPVYRLP